MLRREFIKLGLTFSLFPKIETANTFRVIYYWNLHSPPHGLDGAVKIINALDPDMIWYAHWMTGFPMPKDLEQAYEIAKSCGIDGEEFKKWCEKEAYTLQHVKQQVKAVGDRIYCPCILGYSNFRIDFNFDPITFECYDQDKINSMLLDLGKWEIINPKTRKPYTLYETQKIFWEMGLPEHNGIFDTSSKSLIDYQIKKAKALKGVGVRAVWYDMFFQLPLRLKDLLNLDYSHQMIMDLYNGCCDIIDQTKALGMIVGTWTQCLRFPYERVPKVDFVTASPDINEILSLKPNYAKWENIANTIKEKRPEASLLIIFDFANRDDMPLAVFSQKLAQQQQRQFLIELHKLAEHLRQTGINTSIAYPIHGPGLGRNPKKLAWGKYKYYDALAPEFNTYETVENLMSGKPVVTPQTPFISVVTLLAILIALAFKKRHS